MRISDWSSDMCSSDLLGVAAGQVDRVRRRVGCRVGERGKRVDFGSGRAPSVEHRHVSASKANMQKVLTAVEEASHTTGPKIKTEEGSEGTECTRTWRSRWQTITDTKKNKQTSE